MGVTTIAVVIVYTHCYFTLKYMPSFRSSEANYLASRLQYATYQCCFVDRNAHVSYVYRFCYVRYTNMNEFLGEL